MKAVWHKAFKMSLFLALMLTMVLAIAACGGSSDKETVKEEETTEQTVDNSDSNKKLVGTWSGTDAEGKTVTAVFNEDGSVSVNNGEKLFFSVVPDSTPLNFLVTNEVITKENEASVSLPYDIYMNSDTEILLKDLNAYTDTTLTKQ